MGWDKGLLPEGRSGMSHQDADQVREEAYRAAAGAVDRILDRIGIPGTDRLGEVGHASWDRFQAELGRVVDLNLDMVRNAFGLYSTLLDPESLRGPGASDVLVLGPVVPGGTAGSVLWLHNYDDEPVTDVALVGSVLTNTGSGPANPPQWTFSPSAVTVPARSAVPVMVELALPKDAPVGDYEATVTPGGGPGEPVSVRVEVVAPSPVAHDSW